MGFIGGEKYEVKSLLQNALRNNGQNETRINSWQTNYFTKEFGHEKYFNDLNRGKNPVVLKGLSGSPKSIGSFHVVQVLLTVFLMLPLVRFFRARTDYDLFIAGFFSYLLITTAFARILTDIWRYVIPGWSLFAVLMLYGLKELIADGSSVRTCERE